MSGAYTGSEGRFPPIPQVQMRFRGFGMPFYRANPLKAIQLVDFTKMVVRGLMLYFKIDSVTFLRDARVTPGRAS